MANETSAPSIVTGLLGAILAWCLANPAPVAAIVASAFTAWAMWQRSRAENARRKLYERGTVAAAEKLPE